MQVRRAAVLAAALVVATALASCGGSETPKARDGESALTAHPVPSGDAVLAMPGAEVHQDFFATNDAGDLLSSVIVPEGRSTEWCESTSPAALVWSGHDGGRRVWAGDVMARMIAPADGGFVVGAVRPDCAAKGESADPGPYLVTGSGDTVEIRWPDGADGDRARELCSADAADERCHFSAVDGTVRVTDPVGDLPPKAILVGDIGGVRVARSVNSQTLWWSADSGETWQQRRTTLPHLGSSVGPVTSASLFGFTNGTSLEYSADQGRTWSVRSLPTRLEWVGITESGLLVGVLPPRRPHRWSDYRVVISTDSSWTTMQPMAARATLGPLWTEVHGDVVYVYNNPTKWWISTDAGAHWRVVEPLAAS